MKNKLLSFYTKLSKTEKKILYVTAALLGLSFADRVIVLEAGRVVQHGRPETVTEHVLDEALLSLTVLAEQRAEAATRLQAHGFVVSSNGDPRRLWVRIAGSRKAEPFRVLSDANIPVLDFELSNSPSMR